MTAPNASQALQEILKRDPQSLIVFERYTYVMIFGHNSCSNWRHWQISPFWDMLAIHFVSHFLDNLHIAIMMEAIGVGPWRYCICFDPSTDTYRKLKLLLYSLP